MTQLTNRDGTYIVIIDEEGARKFIKEIDEADVLFACCHGHAQCSTRSGGPCFDETMTHFPQLQDSTVYEEDQ